MTLHRDRPPATGRTGAPPTRPAATTPDSYVDHFRHRVLQDALTEATADYWRHRAEVFASVGTPAADETAQACRHHAHLIATGQLPDLEPTALLTALLEAP